MGEDDSGRDTSGHIGAKPWIWGEDLTLNSVNTGMLSLSHLTWPLIRATLRDALDSTSWGSTIFWELLPGGGDQAQPEPGAGPRRWGVMWDLGSEALASSGWECCVLHLGVYSEVRWER